MDDHPSLQEARQPATMGVAHDAPGQAGVMGIALAAVLTATLAQGSWQWFSSYIGVTLIAVIFSFYRLPGWVPGLGSAYMRNLAAFSLVVGLCVAITLAPVLQRSASLFRHGPRHWPRTAGPARRTAHLRPPSRSAPP